MATKFKKSKSLGGGVKLNLNKKSASVSFGGKGFRQTFNTSGRSTTTFGIPGTGISHTTSRGSTARNNTGYAPGGERHNPQSTHEGGAPRKWSDYESMDIKQLKQWRVALILSIIMLPASLLLLVLVPLLGIILTALFTFYTVQGAKAVKELRRRR